MPKTKVLINGYCRIGRILHRIIIENDDPNLEVVGINSRADARSHAHLLKYDSTYGILDRDISYGEDYIQVDGKRIKVYVDKNPGEIDFREEGIDIVTECTGNFRDRESAKKQLAAGAKKIIISAPGKDDDVAIVLGVNQEKYQPTKHHIVSSASCTTICLATVGKVLQDNFGINYGQMTTGHA